MTAVNYGKIYNIDDIIQRYNSTTKREGIFRKGVHECGYNESLNEDDLYPRLLSTDISTGFFKVKTILNYIEEYNLENNLIIQTNIRKNSNDSNDIEFYGTMSKYDDWIRDANNAKYVEHFGTKAFHKFVNAPTIFFVRFNNYNAFKICFIDK